MATPPRDVGPAKDVPTPPKPVKDMPALQKMTHIYYRIIGEADIL
jgi:hypothetical protein